MSEWLKEHAWKACVRQKCTAGSNPALSAKGNPQRKLWVFVFLVVAKNFCLRIKKQKPKILEEDWASMLARNTLLGSTQLIPIINYLFFLVEIFFGQA